MRRFERAALLALLAVAVCAAPARASTFPVTNSADSGGGSLRDAITQANATPAADTITFGIGGSGVHTIALTSDLPEITHPVTIDGYSQTGASANTLTGGSDAVLKIVIDAQTHKGLVVSGGGSTIKGLVIHGAKGPPMMVAGVTFPLFTGDGITLEGTGGNHIEGNFIGTDANGDLPATAAEHNVSSGVRILSGDDNVIGGTTPAQRNVLSGNGDFVGSEGESGVAVNGGTGTLIEGNRIGTNPAGTAAVENARVGVWVDGFNPGGTIDDTTIGGTAAGAGNVISGNGDSAIQFSGAGNGTVQGNRIGTNASGTAAIANDGQDAVRADDDAITIGGTAAGAGNLIAGNAGYGIHVFGSGHQIQGNLIGTDVTGTVALPNGIAGIQIAASGVTVGGTTAAARNVISGNSGVGIGGDGIATSTIEGNYIGTDVTGATALGNGGAGIAFDGGDTNTIGGTTAGAGNVISGNGGSGVSLSLSETVVNDDNVVVGNKIGTNAAGTAALGNDGPGVRVLSGHDSVIGRPGQANLIANNGGDGVLVTGNGGAAGNSIRGNSIAANSGLGVDLGENTTDTTDDGDGVTPNDAGDADTGNNGLQNYPLVGAAIPGAGTAISGTLNSKASTNYTIDLYQSTNCDASGNGEGETHLGSQAVTTNATGNVSWSTTVASTVPAGRSVTATATDPLGNTSEFSPCRQAGQPADLSLTLGTSAAHPVSGTNVTLTTTVANGGPAAATGVTVDAKLPAGFTFVSATPAADYNAATGVWTVGALAASASKQLQVVARVDDGSPVDVTDQVRTSDQGDLDSIPGNSVAGEDDQATVRIAGTGIWVNDNGIAVNSADGHCTLREAIVDANTDTASGPGAGECSAGSGADDITLQNAATYTLATSAGGVNAYPQITSTMTILGRRSSIRRSSAGGTPDFRFFMVADTGDLTIDSVNFDNGRVGGTSCGGAIYNQGKLTVKESGVDTSSVVVPGGNAIGGAICNEGALTVKDSVLNDNFVQGANAYGGAVHSSTPAGKPEATATFENTTIALDQSTGTVDSAGAGIRSLNASLSFSGSHVGLNTAATGTGTGSGGGIAAVGGTLTASGTVLNSNQVTGTGAETRRHGGALALTQGADATLTDVRVGGDPVEANRAVGAGGGISVEGAATKLAMHDGEVTSNTSATSSFTDGGGGGIANGDSTGAPGTVSLDGVTLTGNSCPTCDGGAVFNRGDMTIHGGDMTSNTAASGGAVGNGSGAVTGGETVIDGTTLTGNTASVFGGAAYVPTGSVALSGATVKNSTAIAGGGFLVQPGATLTADTSTFAGNTSSGVGGGISVAGTATLTNTTVGGATAADANQAGGSGGGVVVQTPGKLTMTGGSISGNTTSGTQTAIAGGAGLANGGAFGGFGIDGGTVELTSVEVSGNSAPLADGAGLLNRGTMTVTGGSVTGNSARSGGGIGNGSGAFPGGTLTVKGTAVSDNHVTSFGGGLWVPGGTVTVADAAFDRNTSDFSGGGVYNSAGVLELDNTAVRDGRAPNGGGVVAGGAPSQTTIQSGSTISGNTATVAPGVVTNVGGGVLALAGSYLTINDSTVSGNRTTGAGAAGGGIATDAALTVMNRTRVTGNSAASGGGISNGSPKPPFGDLELYQVTIDRNTATSGAGGGLANGPLGSATLDHSAVTHNTAATDGGGLYNTDTAFVEDSTISGNSGRRGAGLANVTSPATVAVYNATIADNSGSDVGAGEYSEGQVFLANTIVVANRAVSGGRPVDCFGSAVSRGYNLFGDGSPCPHNAVGDQRIDSRLGLTEELFPLADNGGATLTHALRPGSLALDAGSPAASLMANGCFADDQRRLPRNRDGDGDGVATCDVGAVEQQDPLAVPFGLHSIAPVTAPKKGAGLNLTLRGGGFDGASVVQVNGAARPTTFVNAEKITAKLPASDLDIAGDLATVLVTVKQGGQTTSGRPLTITSGRVARSDTSLVAPGGAGYVASAPPAPGVAAQIVNGAGGGPITATAATYSSNPVAGNVFDAAGFTDLQVTGASAGDAVSSSFYYPSSITGAAENALALRYWTGSVWAPVRSSGGVAPGKSTVDDPRLGAGGYFSVTFDETSTPKLSELGGTVFGAAQAAPEASIVFDPGKQDVTVSGIGTTSRRAVKPSRTTKPKGGRVQRTYNLKDKAGNAFSLVLEVKKTKTAIAAHVLSLRYRGGKVVKPGANSLAYKWTLAKRKVATLQQTLSVGTGKTRRKVTAKFDRRTNRTTITDPAASKRPVKKKGNVALRVVTGGGRLGIEY